MRRTFLKTGIIAVCMVLTFGLLSGCGASSPVGTWYVGDSEESFYNFEEDGKISGYRSEIDLIYYGNWTENNGSYVINGSYVYTGQTRSDWTLELTDKDTLYCDEYVSTLKRGPAKEIPNITVWELTDGTWITDDGRYELDFCSDGDWDLYDNDEGETLKEGTFIVEDGNLSMKTEDGIQYQPTIAENRHEITVFDDMVFIKEE